MSAKLLDITIDKGADFEQTFAVVDQNGQPMNITGAGAALQIRREFGDPMPLVTLTSAAKTLKVNGPSGLVTATIPETVTEGFEPGAYVYDLKLLTATGKYLRVFQGAAIVSPEVTTITITPASGGRLDFSNRRNSGLIGVF